MTDNTAAIRAACAALQSMGGGRLVFPPGPRPYNFAGPTGNAVATLERLAGVTIECPDGATLADTTSYGGRQSAVMFALKACRDVDLGLRIVSQTAVAPSSVVGRGLWAVSLEQGCNGVHVDLDLRGCIGGLRPTKAHNDPASYISQNITGRITATGTYYPYASQFGSANVSLEIFADTCGRNFFIYGSRAQRLTIRSRNQQVTSLIMAYSGFGCEDVDIRIVDRVSTIGVSPAPHLTINWGDSTPATHRNLRIDLNLRNASRPPFGHSITFGRYSDGAGTPDATGRGHVLDGLEVTGISEQASGMNHCGMESNCAFALPDAIRRVNIH